MYCKSLLTVLLLLLFLVPGCKTSDQPGRDTVIAIQDTELDSGTPPATPVKRGQALNVYQRAGGRLWVYLYVEENPRGSLGVDSTPVGASTGSSGDALQQGSAKGPQGSHGLPGAGGRGTGPPPTRQGDCRLRQGPRARWEVDRGL